MSSLLLITGPPGAGKSTVASIVADRREPSVLVPGDKFFGFVARGWIAPWLPEAHRQNEVVTEAAAGAAGRYVRGGYPTVYDGMVGPWFLPTFLAATGLDEIHYVIVMPSVETCVERVRTRLDHGFDDEPATRKMHDEFVRAEIDSRYLVDPTGTAADVAGLIIDAWEGGSLVVESV